MSVIEFIEIKFVLKTEQFNAFQNGETVEAFNTLW